MKLDFSTVASVRSFADDVALNPQPLPPRFAASPQLFKNASKLESVGFDPQPEPPKAGPQDPTRASVLLDLDAVALNPQPLPPKEVGIASILRKLDWAALNPQPLPPKENGIASLFSKLDAVALNPQPLPPKETGFASLFRKLDWALLNPQPLPPKEAAAGYSNPLDAVAFNPQPDPPRNLAKASNQIQILMNQIAMLEDQAASEVKSSADHASAMKNAIHKAIDVLGETRNAVGSLGR